MTSGFLKLLLSFGISIMLTEISFKEKQKQFKRVAEAYIAKEHIVESYFKKCKIPYLTFQVFIRAIKDEQVLEIWISTNNRPFTLLTTYLFSANSGILGPKRREGDLQIPEGSYYIKHFNPQSRFHLSLGINYPNELDKILGDPGKPGGEIYIHGNCVSSGCIPITDDKIEEVYIICVEAKNYGQLKIPVHIFPSRLNADGLTALKKIHSASPSLIKFWEDLAPMYQDFEATKKIRDAKVD